MVKEIVQDGLGVDSKAWNAVEDMRAQPHREIKFVPSSEDVPSERPYLAR